MTALNPTITRRPLPPRTHRIPLLGPLPSMLHDPLGFLLTARERHGDVYQLDLGLLKMTALNRAEHVQHVLVDQAANYGKGGAIWDAVRDILGNGLPVSEGDFWLRQRRMMQPHFHRKRLAGLTNQIVEATQASFAPWDAAAAGGQPFDVSGAFAPITMRVITRLLFGQALSPQAIDAAGTSMAYMVNYLTWGALTRSLPAWAVPGSRRFAANKANADSVINQLIERQRHEQLADDTLLALMVEMVDAESGDSMTNAQLRDEAISMFLAGYETTSMTLAWIFYYLTHNPEIGERLRAEVDEVLGDRAPTFEDLPRLTYTRMVLQEALRMRPAAWRLTRTALADDEIDGYAIPAGTTVGLVFYAVHHHPEHWEQPERFDPDRFSAERSAGRHKYAWAPFGAGQRQCIGKDLAMMEGQIILAMLFQRYRISGAPARVGAVTGGTLQVKGALPITLRRR